MRAADASYVGCGISGPGWSATCRGGGITGRGWGFPGRGRRGIPNSTAVRHAASRDFHFMPLTPRVALRYRERMNASHPSGSGARIRPAVWILSIISVERSQVH